MMKNKILLIIIISSSLFSFSQENGTKYAFNNYERYYNEAKKVRNAEKDDAIEKYRQHYSKNLYSHHTSPIKLTAKECLNLLNKDGLFMDYIDRDKQIQQNNYTQSLDIKGQELVGELVFDAYNRIWKIAEAHRTGELTTQEAFTDEYCKAILYYGNIEASRRNDASRFHRSCFGIPTAAANTYFFFLNEMDNAESEQCTDQQKKAVCDMLKILALQAWTQPLRGNFTDNNVVQIERFRKHVWWVGGNAIGYRPLFLCALMYKSIPMIDLIADVSQQSISTVSQNTYNEAFWDEGFTTDGAGWGHGKQCLIWGYPIDGTGNAMKLLGILKASPWEKSLSKENTQALLNFFRGGNWYHYKGYILPCLDRNSAVYYEGKSRTIPYYGMLNNIVSEWLDSFSMKEQAELKQLHLEAQNKIINMTDYPEGTYSGTRWFFNNDDLIKKNEDYHIIVNMASLRCDGLESAIDFADNYNFFTNDGLTLFQRQGDEYRKIIGAWDITAYPGVTAREGMDKITPVTNWRGYNSKHNFAGAATHGSTNAVAGFIFEKGNGTNKDDNNYDNAFYQKNPRIFDVLAYKSYFMMDDYLIALGAGITNLKPKLEGAIRTTIDQTAKEDDAYTIEKGKKKKITEGVHSFINKGKAVWVTQNNGFAYTVLPEFSKNAYYTVETKNNEWIKRNKENRTKKDLPENVDIFRLWLDHGQTPKDDTYGYVVYCGTNPVKEKLPFKVLRNDKKIQAIQSSDKKIIEAVFYDSAETLSAKGLELSVSSPSIVLIEDMGDEYIVSVNDPQMLPNLAQINIRFNNKKVIINMPQGSFCGKPMSVKIKK